MQLDPVQRRLSLLDVNCKCKLEPRPICVISDDGCDDYPDCDCPNIPKRCEHVDEVFSRWWSVGWAQDYLTNDDYDGLRNEWARRLSVAYPDVHADGYRDPRTPIGLVPSADDPGDDPDYLIVNPLQEARAQHMGRRWGSNRNVPAIHLWHQHDVRPGDMDDVNVDAARGRNGAAFQTGLSIWDEYEEPEDLDGYTMERLQAVSERSEADLERTVRRLRAA